jgi:hypothetical protein
LHYNILPEKKDPEGEILTGTLNSSLKKEKGSLGTSRGPFSFCAPGESPCCEKAPTGGLALSMKKGHENMSYTLPR